MASSSGPRVGIVGCGIRGTLYARALCQQTAVTVGALCDRSPEAADAAGALFQVPVYHSHQEMFAGERLDAVVIATPDFAHVEPVVDAVTAGLDMMVEKPLATSVLDAQRMQEAVTGSGVRCMLGFENRWNPRFVTARQLVLDADFGPVLTQTAHLHDSVFVPTRMLSWAAGSSPAWFLMPHTLDLVLWLGRGEVASVYATGVRRHLLAKGVDTWDSVDALLTFTNGSTAALHSSWVLPETFPSVFDFRYEIIGADGALRIDATDHGVHHISRSGYRWAQHGVYETDGELAGFPVDMAASFARWLATGQGDVPDIEDGLKVTRIIEAIHQSLKTAKPVALAIDHSSRLPTQSSLDGRVELGPTTSSSFPLSPHQGR